MNGKEFLEDFDPQIKEVGYDNYSYTPNQVIQRLDAFKKQLLLHNVVGQSEQLPDENLYQPCEGCTTSCKSWEVFFCKKLVG
jgi:hypothetical protein